MNQEKENRPGLAMRGLGALEAQLMGALWGTETPLTVQEVVDALGPGHNYKTVMTVLNRLVEKALLGRKLDGRAYRYQTRQSREQFLRAVADELVRGYLEAYGTQSSSHLIDALDRMVPRSTSAAPSPPTTANSVLSQPDYYDAAERRPTLANVIGIAALLQIITLFLRRRH